LARDLIALVKAHLFGEDKLRTPLIEVLYVELRSNSNLPAYIHDGRLR
jgi:hypothetical protein